MRVPLRWALCSLVALGACGQQAAPKSDDFGYNGTGIAVGVSPLTLDSLGDACYSFAVVNQANQLVVGRGPSVNGIGGVTGLPIAGNALDAICASRFGNTQGGDISYVAPCDAQQPAHTVHLWVEALCAAGQTGEACAEIQDYVNPCSAAGGCTLPVTCVENADTPVTFNFTIMGQADQGFFDIAVNFENIFCSAKLDTCYGNDPETDAIELLFDVNGDRAPTAVLGLACTAGAGTAQGTFLHAGNVQVDCAGVVTTLDLSTLTSEGNQPAVDGIAWAAYFGSESLSGAAGSWNKEFLNLALTGFGNDCTVAWVATASDGSLPGSGGPAGVLSSYPVINYGPTAVTAADGAWLCTQNPINEPGSGVTTTYVDCTEPGDCLGGPCITTQNGTFIPCEAGDPSACDPAADGITVTYTSQESDTDTTILTFFLQPGPDAFGSPTYSTTVILGNGPTTFSFAKNASGNWVFSVEQEGNSDQQAENADLLGTWSIQDVLTLELTCGIEGTYACASWENTTGDVPVTEYLDLLPATFITGPTTITGWGGTETSGVFYQTAPTLDSVWQVSLPQHYELTSTVPVGSDPWGVYTTIWDGTVGTDLYGNSIVVTIDEGQCPEQVIIVDPPPAPLLFGSHTLGTTGAIDRFEAGPVPASLTPLADAAAPATADLLPINSAITHFDLAFDSVTGQLFGHSSVVLSPILGRTPLGVAVWDDVVVNPATTVSAAYRTHNGVDAFVDWSVVSGITNSVLEQYNVVVSNGSYVDPAGNRVLLAMQYGLRAGDTDRALHVFALQLVPDGTDLTLGRILVTHIHSFGFGVNDGPTETAAQQWALIGPTTARNLTLERDGRVFLTGFGLSSATIPGIPTYLHSFQLSGGSGAYTLSTPSSFTVGGAQYSIQGLVDASHLLMLRMDAVTVTYDVVKPSTGAVSATFGSTIPTPATAFFGTYEPTNGYLYGLFEGTSFVSYHHAIDVTSGNAVPGSIVADENVVTPYKINSLSFVHN